MRQKYVHEGPAELQGEELNREGGVATASSGIIDMTLSWKDIAWFKSITKLPIVLKGIQVPIYKLNGPLYRRCSSLYFQLFCIFIYGFI